MDRYHPTVLALLLLTLAAAPPALDRTYSFWLGTERVGIVRLRLEGDRFRYESTRVIRRGPALEATSFWSETDLLGRGKNSDGKVLSGPEPSTLALTQFRNGEAQRCIAVEDEHDGRRGEVCGQRQGSHLEGILLGEPFTGTLGDDGAPEAIDLPKQRVHFAAERGEVPLPQPRDLFARAIPASGLEPHSSKYPARLVGESEFCKTETILRAGPGVPPQDEFLPPLPPRSATADVARDATRGDRSVWAATGHLVTFVDKAIASSAPEVDEHDAQSTWNRRRGGCVGHAAVFALLARTLGIKVRTVYGMLFEEEAWHAHAWNEVLVGDRFYGVDPSRGAAAIGSEHVAVARDDDPDPLRPGRCMLALPSMTWTLTPLP